MLVVLDWLKLMNPYRRFGPLVATTATALQLSVKNPQVIDVFYALLDRIQLRLVCPICGERSLEPVLESIHGQHQTIELKSTERR